MMQSQKTSVGVVGLSHLGIVTSIGFASFYFRIVGIDIDARRVAVLNKGDCMLPEPNLSQLLQKYGKNLSFTTDFSKLARCKIVILAQDTPVNEKNEMELNIINDLIIRMIPHISQGTTIILMSQISVGFTRRLLQQIHNERPELTFTLLYWAETLIIGDAVERFLRPERIIVGSLQPSQPLPISFNVLLKYFDCPILQMNYESAEMTKAAMNLYLASTVTFANTLANLCEKIGADTTEIIPALRLDKRVGPSAYIQPGLGFSGGHLERDIVALTKLSCEQGIDCTFINAIKYDSAKRYQWLIQNINSRVFTKNSFPTIALWGLSYKKNTDSTHGAPSLKIIRDYGDRAQLIAYDPAVKLPRKFRVRMTDEKYRAIEGADCLLILSNWDEFRNIDPVRIKKAMKTPCVIDPAGIASAVDFRREGITSIIMGRTVYEERNIVQSGRYYNRRQPGHRQGNSVSICS